MNSQGQIIRRPSSLATLCVFLVMLLAACSSNTVSTDVSDWIEYSFVIDADVEVRIKLPYAKYDKNIQKSKFLATKSGMATDLFHILYDPGWGRDRELLLTHISGIVVQIERDENNESALTLDEYKEKFLLTTRKAKTRFEFLGVQNRDGRQWLKVNLLGSPWGVAYSTLIHGELILDLGITVFGENANESRLFQKRLATMEQIISTVQVSAVEIR